MSRCFVYPPPGYIRNGIRDEALIESVKEGKKAKKERKKDKKREKREKEKPCGSGDIESKNCSHKKRHKGERSNEDQKRGDLQKRTEKETEQLEKSCLTEERGHPVGSQTSSDSTLNSNKRQKLSLPLDGRHNSGSIIRIRVPSQRHKDPEVLPIKEHPCTGPGRTDDTFIQLMHEPTPGLGKEAVEYSCSTSTRECPEFAIQLSKQKPRISTRVTKNSYKKLEKPCLSTRVIEGSAQMAETSVASNLCCHCPPKLAPKFRDVIENWVPLSVQSHYTGFDDQEWLFETKHNHRIEAKKCELNDVGLSRANSTTMRSVCYLPDADIYALPFTVPF